MKIINCPKIADMRTMMFKLFQDEKPMPIDRLAEMVEQTTIKEALDKKFIKLNDKGMYIVSAVGREYLKK